MGARDMRHMRHIGREAAEDGAWEQCTGVSNATQWYETYETPIT
jgi:hypothetical protein